MLNIKSDTQRVEMKENYIKSSFLSQTIDGRFSNIANTFPDNIAYVDHKDSITYQQLSNQVDLIASIIQKNLPDETIVGLYFEQSLAFIVCFLGVIRAGKVAVPLDTKSPENRLLRLISHAEIKTIIKGDELPYFDNKALSIMSYSDFCQKEGGTLTISDNINNEAVILYTSGSTGESKGVIHAHKSLMHHTYRFTKLLSLSHTDKSTLLYNTAYFGGLRDILSALLNGGALYHYSIEKNGYSQLPTWLEKNKITIYTSVITVFRQLCNAIEKGKDLKSSSLRAVRIGSDVCLRSDFEKYKTYFPDNCLFVSGLASSETGLIRQNVLTKDSIVIDSIPNGYPVEDVDVYIKNELGETLEDGEIGTLVIASDYLSLGYKNMPELTADKYKINSVSGQREFWSGDTGYIKDGSLVFAGRTDTQVKISGRRIDLAEIDSVVMDLNGITNSIALYYEETKSIVLFVEISKNNLLSKEDVSKYLSANLPFYMQPTRIIILSTFPLSPSFKVNKKELYELIKEYEHPYVEPANAVETEIIKVFCNVLNKEKIGIHDNFFELGGDSISATSASVMLEKIFNVEIPYGYLYQAQTAQLFAQAIQANNFDKPLKWLSLINQGGGVPIYWLLNGATTLKKYLPDDQELYVINTHYDHGTLSKQLTVELICNEFSEEILKVNRGNHCIIGGFSMGARFAYETARQLKKAGMTIDLLILLDPAEPKSAEEKKIKLGDTCNRIKSLYYTYTNTAPSENFKQEYVYQFYKSLRKKQLLTQYDDKVLLIQRAMNMAFEDRDWPKIADISNLIFYTLEIDDHLEVVNDSNMQLQWVNKIKEHI